MPWYHVVLLAFDSEPKYQSGYAALLRMERRHVVLDALRATILVPRFSHGDLVPQKWIDRIAPIAHRRLYECLYSCHLVEGLSFVAIVIAQTQSSHSVILNIGA